MLNLDSGKRHGTNHTLISELIKISIDRGKFVFSTFVDRQKASDAVDKPFHYCSISCQSYLTNGSQIVTIQGIPSDRSFIKPGVPQGSVLGLLFLVY